VNYRVVNLRSEEERLFDYLRELELPYKIYAQRILPKATVPQFKYLWGVCYKIIADYIGTTPQKVHIALMKDYNTEYLPTGNPLLWDLRTISASEFSSVDIAIWVEKVCAWAINELGVYVPLPNETWQNNQK